MQRYGGPHFPPPGPYPFFRGPGPIPPPPPPPGETGTLSDNPYFQGNWRPSPHPMQFDQHAHREWRDDRVFPNRQATSDDDPRPGECTGLKNGEVAPQAESREPWLRDWIELRKAKKSHERGAQEKLSTACARMLLKSALHLLDELRMIKTELETRPPEEQGSMIEAARDVQDRMNDLRNQVNLEEMHKKLKRTRLKRARLRRQRQKRFEEKHHALVKRREIEDAIDQWGAQIRTEELEKKREKDMKSAADATLSEVRKKLSEARKCREILDRLTKLRQVRKDAMERMGLYTDKETDSNFVTRRDHLDEVMKKQLTTYEIEETALKVMLEAEAEESKEKLKEEIAAGNDKQFNRRRTKLRRFLFGLDEIPKKSHPVRKFWEYYTSADYNIQSFLAVRQQWDSNLVPAGSPSGSAVPPGWVLPSPPSDAAWKSVLKRPTEA